MTSQYEEGNPQSKLLVLAQAPSFAEARMQKPLVGPSGQVFKECLHEAGIARGDCYILNLWQEPVWTNPKTGLIYESRDGPKLWGTGKGGGITAHGWELAQPTLERIRASGANCILALGQQALEAATGIPDKILKWRGSIIAGTENVGFKKVVGTVHPAATIHGVYLWRYLIINDMRRAGEERQSPTLSLPERDIQIRPTLAQVLRYIERCRKIGIVATDIEVVNHQVSCFSLSPDPSEALVVPLTCEGGDYWSEEDECIVWDAYAGLMEDPSVTKVNQNLIGFDAPFLARQMGIQIKGLMEDTMIAWSVLYPEFNKGLDIISSVLTREPYWKDEGKMWKNEGGDFETFWRYNGKDSAVALEDWYALEKELTEKDMWPTYRKHTRMGQPLLFMSQYGLAVDHNALEHEKEKINASIKEKEEKLESVADYPFNPGSPAQCAKYFYEHKGLKPYKNKSGGTTTDDKAMSRIFRKTNLPEAKLVQEIRADRKLRSSYLEVAFDPDGRLRCNWNPRGTKFGRLSSSQTILGTGMNLQNIDPRFKSFIVED
jgi:uracil-DNA glycosylase